jgi:hypothetical protein
MGSYKLPVKLPDFGRAGCLVLTDERGTFTSTNTIHTACRLPTQTNIDSGIVGLSRYLQAQMIADS